MTRLLLIGCLLLGGCAPKNHFGHIEKLVEVKMDHIYIYEDDTKLEIKCLRKCCLEKP